MKTHLPLNKLLTGAVVVLLIMFGYGWLAIARPVSSLSINQTLNLSPVSGQAVDLAWPSYGQSAFSLDFGKVTESHGQTSPQPTASIAKLMTALSVLDKYPLTDGDDGPTITLTEQDVELYKSYVAKDGSVVYVRVGEKINLRQALTAMLLPSANNMADTLAIWAYGSMDEYTAYANQKAPSLGMANSHFADASGFSPSTTSTALDLVKLGEAALGNSAIASIVSQSTAVVPVAGTIHNTNYLLGDNGIYGIKTGNTDQAGGCYLFASKITPAGSDKPVTIVGAILGSSFRTTAINNSLPLINSIAKNLTVTNILKSGDVVATYKSDWGQEIKASANTDLNIVQWGGEQITPQINLTKGSANDVNKLASLGTVKTTSLIHSSETDISLSEKFLQPSIWWRLTHPGF